MDFSTLITAATPPVVPEITGLTVLWFVLVGVLWTGYLVLGGFDLGVGMLTTILPKGDAATRNTERRVLINTIGPVWDGNQVWLLTAGGATFAAFPEWYATMFSGFYLALLLILVALILRGMSFEYRGKIKDEGWSNIWDWCLTIGSWLPAFLWGVAFGNLVRGIELGTETDTIHQYVGGFWALLNPFSLVGGVVTLVLFLLHGSLYTALKTQGPLRERARALASKVVLVAIVGGAAWLLWAQFAFSRNAWTWAAVVVIALSLVGIVVTNAQGREGLSFILSVVVWAGAVVFIFGSMYPYAIPALNSQDPAFGLFLAQASSTTYTLTVMTVVACIFVPIVLAYTAWSYWTFRYRISADSIPASIGLALRVRAATQKAFGGSEGKAESLDLSVLEPTASGKGTPSE
jgi:cytochrome d ubiquinol oxidase subunit II